MYKDTHIGYFDNGSRYSQCMRTVKQQIKNSLFVVYLVMLDYESIMTRKGVWRGYSLINVDNELKFRR